MRFALAGSPASYRASLNLVAVFRAEFPRGSFLSSPKWRIRPLQRLRNKKGPGLAVTGRQQARCWTPMTPLSDEYLGDFYQRR